MLEPGLRNRFKSDLVALPSNECDKRLPDVERGAVALTVEGKQHIALTTQVDQLLQFCASGLLPGGFEDQPRDFVGMGDQERWLAFTSMVLAPIRLAMKRSRSGLMVRSSVETA